jgi:hypothetical protein
VFRTVYDALEQRWANRKATVITANHDPVTVANKLTEDVDNVDSIVSRLTAGRVVSITGKDQREGKA